LSVGLRLAFVIDRPLPAGCDYIVAIRMGDNKQTPARPNAECYEPLLVDRMIWVEAGC